MTTISDKQFLFVVGAPRSGTTWLHHMLAEHPDVASMEPELTVFSYLHLWEQRFQREKTRQEQGLWRQGGTASLHGGRILPGPARHRAGRL
ncbi:MAG: sulfotransferase [Flavobacteriales bacterium]|nr:sulfotransferase [Flavobacteriales bacterium]